MRIFPKMLVGAIKEDVSIFRKQTNPVVVAELKQVLITVLAADFPKKAAWCSS